MKEWRVFYRKNCLVATRDGVRLGFATGWFSCDSLSSVSYIYLVTLIDQFECDNNDDQYS